METIKSMDGRDLFLLYEHPKLLMKLADGKIEDFLKASRLYTKRQKRVYEPIAAMRELILNGRNFEFVENKLNTLE